MPRKLQKKLDGSAFLPLFHNEYFSLVYKCNGEECIVFLNYDLVNLQYFFISKVCSKMTCVVTIVFLDLFKDVHFFSLLLTVKTKFVSS